MRKTLLAIGVLAASTTLPAQAEYLYGFGNVSINYLDWSDNTESRSGGFKNDFTFLELEGGAGFDWGELYGFFDAEFQESGVATSTKGTIAVKTGLDQLRVYGQSYTTESEFFDVRNTVMGVSYAFAGNNWFFNPWIGMHHTITGGFEGMNGGMAGWVLGYNFDFNGYSFSVSNWHETEFARTDDYVNKSAETDDLSMNGALALWWNATEHLTTGIQYRYSHNKLGQSDYSNAMIYSVKYNF